MRSLHNLPELIGSLEDQVELNHLQTHRDAPVNVTVHDRGLVNQHPVLAHVYAVHTDNVSDQTANVQGCTPAASHAFLSDSHWPSQHEQILEEKHDLSICGTTTRGLWSCTQYSRIMHTGTRADQSANM